MGTVELALGIIIISSSGVLTPGPLFFTNLIYGARDGALAGLKIATGHAIVEISIIITIAIVILTFSTSTLSDFTESNGHLIGFAGGAALIFFAYNQIRNTFNSKTSKGLEKSFSPSKGPVLGGIVFSVLNPFFLLWWVTVGLKLIFDSVSLLGLIAGLSFLFLFHIWMDYLWLILFAYLSSKSIGIVKAKYYNYLITGLSLILLYYGLSYILSSIFDVV